MGRRGRGEGTIRKRADGRWEAAIATGAFTDSGNPKRRSFYGRTRREVAAKLDAEKARWAVGHNPTARRSTLNDAVDRWLESKSDLVDRTLYTYRMELSAILEPLGRRRLTDISPSHVDEALRGMSASGLSHRARARALMHLRSVFESAVDLELIPRNPAKNVRVGRPRVGETATNRSLSKTEATRLMQALGDSALGRQVFLLLSLGLRRGELLGLQWDAVDLERHNLAVKKVLKPTGSGSQVVLGMPKTPRSLRTVPFDASVLGTLRLHQEVGPTTGTFVFVTCVGTPINPRNFTRDVCRAMSKLGIVGNVHSLRHTYASLMLAAGTPVEIVSHRLGHAQVSTTLNIYRHLLDHERNAAAPSLEDLLGAGS